MKNTHIKLFGAAFMGGLMSIGAFQLMTPAEDHAIQVQPRQEAIQPVNFSSTTTAPGMVDLSFAAEATVSEVVHVKVVQEGQEMVHVDPFQYFFNGDTRGRKYKAPDKQGFGSGVVIREDGYIVTNNHVIAGADHIEVVFNDNQSFKAELVGADPSSDLALLKIEADDLEAIPIGNSDDLRLGEWVLAVGNPYNLNSTVTAGIVSAKARSINILQQNNGNPPLESFIQTDAAVNPGNSGGALVNAKGELVGINSAIKSPTGSYSGYSFAIPVNIVKKVVNDIMEYGVVQRAFIGVSIRNIDNQLSQEKELETLHGVYIQGVMPNGAAEAAGIKPGDVVTEINGNKINNVAELQAQVGMFHPGDKILVRVNRAGKDLMYDISLKNKKGTTEIVEVGDAVMDRLGADFKPIQAELAKSLGLKSGIQIVQLGNGIFAKAGMREGFIITSVDKEPVNSIDELEEKLKAKKGGVLIGGMYPNGYKKYYGVGM